MEQLEKVLLLVDLDKPSHFLAAVCLVSLLGALSTALSSDSPIRHRLGIMLADVVFSISVVIALYNRTDSFGDDRFGLVGVAGFLGLYGMRGRELAWRVIKKVLATRFEDDKGKHKNGS